MPDATSAQVLSVQVSRGVATLTLDSPANRNALSRAMRAQLRDALVAALADDAVRVVVLDHTGRVFCSGMDLSEAAGGGAQEQGVREFPELLSTIWSSPKPVVAVVRGPTRAGGVGLLAACDVVVAADSWNFRPAPTPPRRGRRSSRRSSRSGRPAGCPPGPERHAQRSRRVLSASRSVTPWVSSHSSSGTATRRLVAHT